MRNEELREERARVMWEEGGQLRRRREGKLRAGDKWREERARATREEGQRPRRLEGAPARRAATVFSALSVNTPASLPHYPRVSCMLQR